MTTPDETQPRGIRTQAIVVALCMGLGYVGIYLCRKNLSVAIPLLREAWGVSKEQLGIIATAGTLAYMLGKFVSGPLVDRIGARPGYLLALGGVVLFGALGGLAPGLTTLALFYGLNRFFGAAGWNAMMKTTSTWFPARVLATAIGALSLSYVLGGVAAGLFAKQLLVWWPEDWRMVMAVPSIATVSLLVLCWLTVRSGPIVEIPAPEPGEAAVAAAAKRSDFFQQVAALFRRPQYQTICVLSFSLTLIREAISTWQVDFLTGLRDGPNAVSTAAFESIGFDLAGAVPIILMGVLYDRIRPDWRRWVVTGILLLLAVVLALLTTASRANPQSGVTLLICAGLLLYGPYSVLGGVVSLECGGTDSAATAVGIVDGIGYLAAILAGQALGAVLDRLGGYPTAFMLLSILTFVSALFALRLRAQVPTSAIVDTTTS